MSDASRERRIGFLSWLGFWALRMLAFTWRFKVLNREVLIAQQAKGRAAVRVVWHGQQLATLWAIRNDNVAILVSEHGDGEIIARAATRLGCRTVRGSSSRGAARALLAGGREIDAGHDLVITPDGPRGPAKSVAAGAMVIAHRTGVPLIPIGVWASRAWHLSSWDGFMIPKPFAEVRVAYGDPIVIDSDSARKAAEASGAVASAIEAAIRRATPAGAS